MYVSSPNKKILKRRHLCNFHVVHTTPVRQARLFLLYCSDQDVTSPDNSCMSITVPVPSSVPHPPIPATPGTEVLSHISFSPVSVPSLPFALRATIYVLSRPFVAQTTTFPGIPPLVTLNSHYPSSLISDFHHHFHDSWDLYPITHCPLPNCLQLGFNHPLCSSRSQKPCQSYSPLVIKGFHPFVPWLILQTSPSS